MKNKHRYASYPLPDKTIEFSHFSTNHIFTHIKAQVNGMPLHFCIQNEFRPTWRTNLVLFQIFRLKSSYCFLSGFIQKPCALLSSRLLERLPKRCTLAADAHRLALCERRGGQQERGLLGPLRRVVPARPPAGMGNEAPAGDSAEHCGSSGTLAGTLEFRHDEQRRSQPGGAAREEEVSNVCSSLRYH